MPKQGSSTKCRLAFGSSLGNVLVGGSLLNGAAARLRRSESELATGRATFVDAKANG